MREVKCQQVCCVPGKINYFSVIKLFISLTGHRRKSQLMMSNTLRLCRDGPRSDHSVYRLRYGLAHRSNSILAHQCPPVRLLPHYLPTKSPVFVCVSTASCTVHVRYCPRLINSLNHRVEQQEEVGRGGKADKSFADNRKHLESQMCKERTHTHTQVQGEEQRFDDTHTHRSL